MLQRGETLIVIPREGQLLRPIPTLYIHSEFPLCVLLLSRCLIIIFFCVQLRPERNSDPHRPRKRHSSTVVLGACTKLDRALELLDLVLADDPQNGAALEKKALVLWLLHRYENAAQVARDVLMIMPDSEFCLERLRDYETLAGNSRRAQHYQARLSQLQNG